MVDVISAGLGHWASSDASSSCKDPQVARPGRDASPILRTTLVVRMIAIGERTGALETLLEKIAEFCDSQVNVRVSRTIVILGGSKILAAKRLRHRRTTEPTIYRPLFKVPGRGADS